MMSAQSHSPQHGDFPDHARTMRSHAGEAIEDTRNWPGMILVGLGIVTVGLTLVAAGYGFEGWAIIGGIAAALFLIIGAVLILAEHRRLQKLSDRNSGFDDRGH
ncbi:hypothetical protein IU443_03095 [Nocardia farcinica]|nr:MULTISPECIES: hypothetical protein [Nocardia]AXK84830.1 hypothetical protein DXT66_03500 [Nocardia farcinica]MBA4854519.1 hypothetical protein [Nocardia farcinica]MBC9814704.1 hypothetical protein [Nocardia farcinica]MBF6067462.1 hypothetical protein [Nocardia farcinica]MBF6139829.1 hypothetical protein [Nocardia farcinica]